MPQPDGQGDYQDNNGTSSSPILDDLVSSIRDDSGLSMSSTGHNNSDKDDGHSQQVFRKNFDNEFRRNAISPNNQMTAGHSRETIFTSSKSLDGDVNSHHPHHTNCDVPDNGSRSCQSVLYISWENHEADLSEFERVWEAANDITIKPAAIASAETLSSATPHSCISSHLLPSRSGTAADFCFAKDLINHDLPEKEVVLVSSQPDHRKAENKKDKPLPFTRSLSGNTFVKRSFSFVDSSALKTRFDSSVFHTSKEGKVRYLKKSPSYGGIPIDICPLHDGHCEKTVHLSLCTGEIELHVRLPHLELDAGNHSEFPQLSKGTVVSLDEIPCQSSDQDSVRPSRRRLCSFSSGIGEPSVYHALVVIFLEFFAWGLLTSPMILVLKETFPDHTFLMNGIIMGIKGILSFLSAPLIGALSDVWGRKFFLFITVFFTCLPIPFMKIDTWWYFALISMSGVFAVTYSIVFAYVADVTDPAERHKAYGLVSATFAASLVISPAAGAYLSQVHSDDLVVGLATAIAVLDIFFILVAVPESLPEKLRLSSTWSTQISWEQADPFSTLWKVSKDRNILLISVTVFLSYLPEAGQLSCFFVYLQLVMGFGPEMVATFIAAVGIMSVIAQTALLSLLIRTLSNKSVISVGLVFEMLQLMWYGFGSQAWMMWAAGVLAAISSITYPAISSYVSTHTDVDKQGVVQGIVTGMRGLCAGLGPAVFGFIFYLFHVDLNAGTEGQNSSLPQGVAGGSSANNSVAVPGQGHISNISHQVPGPPFVFGAMLVLLALTVSAFIPEEKPLKSRKQSASTLDLGYNRDHKKNDSLDGTSQPLMNETGVL